MATKPDVPSAPDLADLADPPPPTGSMLEDLAPFGAVFVTPPEPVDPDRPDRDAPKADWAAYAIQRGVPSYEAWALSKADLIREVS